jgi:hypothetical protein
MLCHSAVTGEYYAGIIKACSVIKQNSLASRPSPKFLYNVQRVEGIPVEKKRISSSNTKPHN